MAQCEGHCHKLDICLANLRVFWTISLCSVRPKGSMPDADGPSVKSPGIVERYYHFPDLRRQRRIRNGWRISAGVRCWAPAFSRPRQSDQTICRAGDAAKPANPKHRTDYRIIVDDLPTESSRQHPGSNRQKAKRSKCRYSMNPNQLALKLDTRDLSR